MQLPEIKQRLSIQTVLTHYGLKPNRNNMLKCPFHEDSNASMKVYTNTNTFNCFGCSKNGDQIEFIQLKEKCTKHEALKKATELINPIEISRQSNQTEPVVSEVEPPEPKQPDYIKLFEDFKYAFQRSPKAKEYLKSRNLSAVTSSGAEMEVGYNTGNKYDKLKHCIVFPLKNSQGQTVSLYGRSIIDSEKAGRHFYTPNRKGLYPRYPKTDTEILILTEAIIDAATLLQYPDVTPSGVEVLSLYGTNGLTEEHKRAIKELNQLGEIILFFDGDQAGREAISKHAETLQELKPDITINYVETPKDEDINSLAISHEPEVFTHLLQTQKS